MALIPHASSNLVMATARLGFLETDPETLRVWSMRCLLGIDIYEEKGKTQDQAEGENKAQSKPEKASANFLLEMSSALELAFSIRVDQQGTEWLGLCDHTAFPPLPHGSVPR